MLNLQSLGKTFSIRYHQTVTDVSMFTIKLLLRLEEGGGKRPETEVRQRMGRQHVKVPERAMTQAPLLPFRPLVGRLSHAFNV